MNLKDRSLELPKARELAKKLDVDEPNCESSAALHTLLMIEALLKRIEQLENR